VETKEDPGSTRTLPPPGLQHDRACDPARVMPVLVRRELA